MKKRLYRLLPLLIAIALVMAGCQVEFFTEGTPSAAEAVSLEEVPAYQGFPYVELNGNQPDFTPEELSAQSFEEYSPLDSLGRCGTATACVGEDLMPTQDRESISQVHPTGWQTAEYDFVDGGYLYNRCHLIGFQLTGENANENNLITGTRYLNVEGMLPFENMTADYIKETENHVLYRVTPLFQGDELVARGVEMEGFSVEDQGEGICFHVYVYNVQPGVEIDYATGDSRASGEVSSSGESQAEEGEEEHYVLNTRSHKFHLPACPSVDTMSEQNKEDYYGTRQELLDQGYEPCGSCQP